MAVIGSCYRLLLVWLVAAGLMPRVASAGDDCDPQEVWNTLYSLRTLQQQNVSIEIRFITISDRFFERIGVDFEFDPAEAPCSPEFNGTGDPFPTGENPTPLPNPLDQPNLLRLPAHTGIDFALFQLNGLVEKDDFLRSIFAEPSAKVHLVETEVVGGDVITIHDPMNRSSLLNAWKLPGLGLTLKTGITADGMHAWVSTQPFYHGVIPLDTFSPIGGAPEVQPGDPTAEFPANPQATARSAASVTVPSESSLVYAGLLRQPAASDPASKILARIPLIKRLFSNVGLQETNQQLLIMITPKIVISEESPVFVTADGQSVRPLDATPRLPLRAKSQ
jgi:general secretion pathway protein D